MFAQRYRAALMIMSRLRASLMRAGYHSKPRFLIIGAQKAGTTALYYYVSEHPYIVPSRDKEIGFFTPEVFEDWPEHPNHLILCTPKGSGFFDPQTYPKRAAWYHSHFPLPHRLGPHRMTFEATPEYLYYPTAAERIHRYSPKMKLIVLLRDPVLRAFSAWNMYRRFGEGDYRPLVYAPRRETRDFDTAVQDEIDEIRSGRMSRGPGYVQRGLYHEQLLPYLDLFSREQILILDSRALRNNTSRVIADVISFLGLPECTYQGEWAPVFEGKYAPQMATAAIGLLREFYRPYNEKLYQLLGHDFGWQ